MRSDRGRFGRPGRDASRHTRHVAARDARIIRLPAFGSAPATYEAFRKAGRSSPAPQPSSPLQKSILPLISISRGSSTLVGRSHVVLPTAGLNVLFTET